MGVMHWTSFVHVQSYSNATGFDSDIKMYYSDDQLPVFHTCRLKYLYVNDFDCFPNEYTVTITW